MSNYTDNEDFENPSQEQEQNKDKKPLSGRKPARVVRGDNPLSSQPKKLFLSDPKVVRGDTLLIQENKFASFLQRLYSVFYLVGLFVKQEFSAFHTSSIGGVVRWNKGIVRTFRKGKAFVAHSFNQFVRQLRQPFRRIQRAWAAEKDYVETTRVLGKVPWRAYGRILRESLGYVWRVLRTLLNHAVVVGGIVLLYVTISRNLALPVSLEVFYENVSLGYIAHESTFSDALREVDGRLSEDLRGEYSASPPLFQVTRITEQMIDQEIIRKRELAKEEKRVQDLNALNALPLAHEVKAFLANPANEALTLKQVEGARITAFYTDIRTLSDGIIAASGSEITEAYGMYADQELLGVVLNGEIVLDELDKIRDSNLTGKPNERTEFDKQIQFKKGLYPSVSVIPEAQLIEKFYERKSVDETYVVETGDTPTIIARKMGISRDTLYELNPGIEDDFRSGKELYVSKAAPFLSVKNIYTDVYIEEAPYRVVETENIIYAIGYRSVERAGVPGTHEVTAEITTVDGVEIARDVLNRKILTEPVEELVIIGSKDPRSIISSGTASSTGFNWPTDGGRITTPLGGYPGHSGADITEHTGPNIYAVASGTVTTATHSYVGFGNYLVIDHGNGYETLYAHNTSLYVSVGDYVAAGQAVAQIGSTGNSSGTHLHIEFREHGQLRNAADFIGTSAL